MGRDMDQDRLYFERRERIERMAAKTAADVRARRAHQELAEGYATLARNGGRSFALPDDHSAVPHLTIIAR